MSRRESREVRFSTEEPGEVVALMEEIAAARSGWINILPGVDEDEVDIPPPATVWRTLFGGSQAPTSMATWMPPTGAQRSGEGVTVGITHPKGRGAIGQLGEVGVTLPREWVVRQDHARRGLILVVSPSVPSADVLNVACRATEALCVAPIVGAWKAKAYLPIR